MTVACMMALAGDCRLLLDFSGLQWIVMNGLMVVVNDSQFIFVDSGLIWMVW